MRCNQIHCVDGKWYFWDETGADRYGPFNTEELAEEALSTYCAVYLEGKPCGCLVVFRELAI